MKLNSKYVLAAAVLATAMCAGTAMAQDELAPGTRIFRINPRQNSVSAAPTTGSTGQITPVITNHGGPVLGTPSVYVIWYGNWNQSNGTDTPGGQQIVRDFLYGLSGSPYYMTNASYPGVSGSFNVGAEYIPGSPYNVRLTQRSVQTVVSSAISAGKLPLDANGVYFVLTSSDVTVIGGFCTSYCGWHTNGTISGTDIKYSFVGNSARCLSGCAIQSTGPNGNAGVDGMVSVIAHELEETNADPDLNAWYDSSGAENADKCAWTFGQVLTQASNGAYYNMTLPALSVPTRQYEIQRELDSQSFCYVNYVTKAQ